MGLLSVLPKTYFLTFLAIPVLPKGIVGKTFIF
jgi:hypothetical protein